MFYRPSRCFFIHFAQKHPDAEKWATDYLLDVWLPGGGGGGGVLTYLAKRGCATLMGHFSTRNP